jgi:NAD(P)-dependent dehydrogenase (short-subunit alcohol dehydrogenase family)
MDLRLDGQTAIVTGASRGIGLAVTRGLVAEGVRVTAEALKSTAELEELAGTGMVRVVEVDLAEPGGPASLVAAAGDRIDILINNVGTVKAEPVRLVGGHERDIPLTQVQCGERSRAPGSG